MRERRVKSRMMCADMVDICWKDTGGRTRRSTALLEDISHHGACLQLEREMPLETELSIEHASTRMSGRVRYCVYREIGYFLGIEFAEDSKWTERKFRPQHLLNLEKLVLRAAKKASRRVQ